jgi:hypothetical protein
MASASATASGGQKIEAFRRRKTCQSFPDQSISSENGSNQRSPREARSPGCQSGNSAGNRNFTQILFCSVRRHGRWVARLFVIEAELRGDDWKTTSVPSSMPGADYEWVGDDVLFVLQYMGSDRALSYKLKTRGAHFRRTWCFSYESYAAYLIEAGRAIGNGCCRSKLHVDADIFAPALREGRQVGKLPRHLEVDG